MSKTGHTAVNPEGLGAELREIIAKAWLDGFMASAEGYNGEYPFNEQPDEKLTAMANIYAANAPGMNP